MYRLQLHIKTPVVLGPTNQLTKYSNTPALPNEHRLLEDGDHLMFWYRALMGYVLVVSNIGMQMRQKPNGKKNHGLLFNGNETEEAYLARIENRVSMFAYAIKQQPDAQFFPIQEGVIRDAHKQLFEHAIHKYLPGWKLAGGTQFGLWFIVKESYDAKIDDQLRQLLKEKELDSRLSTLNLDPSNKLSNIHVPYGKHDTNTATHQYQDMVRIIIEDLIKMAHLHEQSNLDPALKKLQLQILHSVSDKEHKQDNERQVVSVCGVTEFVLIDESNVRFFHTVAGDFNLELAERQKTDALVFKDIQREYQYEWVMNTVSRNMKYVCGLIVSGGATLLFDLVSLDETEGVAVIFASYM